MGGSSGIVYAGPARMRGDRRGEVKGVPGEGGAVGGGGGVVGVLLEMVCWRSDLMMMLY